MQAERLGDGLTVKQKPGTLRLTIQPKPSRMVPDAWLGLGLLFFVMLGIGVGLFYLIGTPLKVFDRGERLGDIVWVTWVVFTGFIVCAPVMIISRGWKRAIFIARQHDEGEQTLRFRIRWPFSFSRLRCHPDDIRRLRLHSGHPGVWRRNDKDKHVFAKAHWWLLFETTSDVQYAINLPVDDEHLDQLSGMISEVFGQECDIVRAESNDEDPNADAASTDR